MSDPTTAAATTSTDAAATTTATESAAPAAQMAATTAQTSTEVQGVAATVAPTGAPEAYADFTVPEGLNLDTAEIGGLAKTLNLDQDTAQKVVDLNAKAVQSYAKAQVDTVTALHADWRAQVAADGEIGGDKLTENLARAKAAMQATSTPQLQVLLDKSGLGNHPEVIRHFLKVAPAFLTDNFVPGSTKPAGVEKTAAKVLYPTGA